MTHTNSAMDLAPSTSRILLANDASEMTRFYAFIEELCEQHNYPDSFRLEAQLALEEVLVNVFNYAHPKGSGVHHIELLFRQEGDMALFTVVDDGMPFDPTQHAPVDIDAPIEERVVGGLGIHMVRNLMDGMAYRREKERNVLTLRKKIVLS